VNGSSDQVEFDIKVIGSQCLFVGDMLSVRQASSLHQFESTMWGAHATDFDGAVGANVEAGGG